MEKGKVNFTILCDKGEIARRLREAVKLGGGNSAVMAQSGIPSRTLGNYLSGRSEPKIGTLVRLSEACEVSLDWLATGEGTMRPMPRDPSDVVAGHIRSLGREHAVPAGMVGIPLLTEVAASAGGGAIVWHEDSIDFIHFNESWLRQTYRVNPANLSALPVTG